MDFGTLKSHVTRNLGNRPDIAAYVAQWINSCYLDIITRGKIPEIGRFEPIPVPELDDTDTFSTAADDYDYAFFTDMLFPVSLRDTTNDQPLKFRSIRWYDRQAGASTGKPSHYATYGKVMFIWPTPDDIYVIQTRFRKAVTIPALSADGDVPIIGTEWHEALELGATYRGARSLRDPDASRWQSDLKMALAAHSEQYTEEEEDADFGVSIKM